MRIANVAEFNKRLSAFLQLVEQGGTVEIRRRNVPVALLVGITPPRRNHTVLGCGEGTVEYRGSVTDPFVPAEDWDMLVAGEAAE